MSRRKERDDKYEALKKEYKRIAKKADQRLVRLEKLAEQDGYSNVKSWSYRKAEKNIKYWSGEGATRFNTKAPNNINLLKAKIRDIQEFLSSATSTKKGITSVYQKRANTLNKKYGTDFNWQDLANYFERGTNEKLDKEFGSKTMLMAVGQIQQHERKILNAIKNGKDIDLNIDNEKVADAVSELISRYGKDVVDLY